MYFVVVVVGIDSPSRAAALVAWGMAGGLLPGAAMGAALALSPPTVRARGAQRSVPAGVAAAGVFLAETLTLGVVSDSAGWFALAVLGTPAALFAGWFLSTPVTAPYRRHLEAMPAPECG
ncbi:hypothetical protein [Kitasatospora sp. McL0602]|uniref:hypothetical protein n=1 Tax=Kitasatospora sp. McL0602 TaxID=3439530 RepID=UPI003F8C11CA